MIPIGSRHSVIETAARISAALHAKGITVFACVQYADLADVVKMLNMECGGSFMQIVNDAQELVDLPKLI